MRAQHYRSSDAVHAAQGAFYESNAETARLEQEMAHLRENRERVERDLADLRAQSTRDREQLVAAQASLTEWRGELARAMEQLASREATVRSEGDKLPLAEEAFKATRNRYEELQRSLALAEQALGVEQTKRTHAGQTLEQLAQRAQRLQEERRVLQAAASNAQQLAQLKTDLTTLDAELESLRAALAAEEERLPQAEQSVRDKDTVLEAAGQRLAGLEAQLQALSQLQERLARGANAKDWLEARGLAKAPRLWQQIRVESGWEDALEAVLRERLNAIALDRMEQTGGWFGEPPPARITAFAPTGESAAAVAPLAGCEPLRRYVSCGDSRLEAVLGDWLHQVYVIPGAADGLAARGTLPAGAMLVTHEGHIFTRNTVSFHAPDSELHGVLTRQREIEQLGVSIAKARPELEAMRTAAEAAEKEIALGRNRLDEVRDAIGDRQQRHHALQLEALRLSGLDQQVAQRTEQIVAELAEIESLSATAVAGQQAAERRVGELDAEGEEQRRQLALASDLYQRAERVLDLQREGLQRVREEAQQAAFHKQSCDNKINEIDNNLKSISESEQRLGIHLAARQQELAGYDEGPLQQRLQQALAVRSEREQALARARDALEGMEAGLKTIDEQRHSSEQSLDPLREKIAEARLKEQEARLNEEQYAQQLADAGAREEDVAQQLEKGMRPNALQGEINRLNEEIKGLGAVNLAALEELQSSRERKDYLEAQSSDLNEAMATLEDAIRRIDRETRERLQHTFDEVNRHFSEMFPALFGGGNAKLVLTGEEILDAGIIVQAQPPGKKNTTIHLLSGGEKALTALSLVFSMFQLNPAPFCLLDEVDAPLDDYNTGRFCDLVKRMSQTSQFLFISHNKITMEIAEQLLGITMQEAGVSRVVAVDIEEAMKLSEAAA
jgi:chromosome segregation protein